MNCIYNYTDHLLFLKERYEILRKKYTHLSHRYISLKLNLKSPAKFTHIINGINKISDKYLLEVVRIFKLDVKEAEYFSILVHLNQASSYFEKIYNFNKLIKFIRSNSHLFSLKLYCLVFEKYYHPLKQIILSSNVINYYEDLEDYLIEPEIELTKQISNDIFDNSYKFITMDEIKHKQDKIKQYYEYNFRFSMNAAMGNPHNKLDFFKSIINLSSRELPTIENILITNYKKIIKKSIYINEPYDGYHIDIQLMPYISKNNNQKFHNLNEYLICSNICENREACRSIRKYYSELIKLSEKAVLTFPVSQLGILSFIVNCNKKNINSIKEYLIKCLEDIALITQNGAISKSKYLLNLQFLPVS